MGISVSNPDLDTDDTVTALGALDATPGILTQIGIDAFTKRQLAVGSRLAIANAAGTDGNPTISLDSTFSYLVQTKAQLKALAIPAAGTACFVQYNATQGDRWGGWFEWISTSQSTGVTNDPAEAVFVPPASAPGGASGAWVRLRSGDFVTAAWFGIRGDAGTTSNTPTMFQRMEDFCNTYSVQEILYQERNYYWSDTIVMRRNFMRHRGLGATQTFFTFNHTNNGIQYGDDTLFCYRPTVEGITYVQASGTAYAHYMYHGRELTIRDYINGSDVRNFIKVGSQAADVTGIANNGSGLIRVTVGSAQNWQTGMKIAITQVDGNASLVSALAAIQFNIVRISSTVFDLSGSTFAGSYTTGGKIGPFTSILELSSDSNGDNMKIRDKYFVDVYSLAGNLIFNGTTIVENPSYVTGSVGIYFRKNTSAFERLDFSGCERLFIRRFKKGIYKDNCRVVSLRYNDIALDECETAFEFIDDDATADTSGTEEIVIGLMRVGFDPTVSSAKSVRIKATTSTITEISIGQFNGIGTDTIIEMIGGTIGSGYGIYHFNCARALFEMRPASATTKDAVTIEGYVEFQFGDVIARAQGNGTERDVFSIASSWGGSGTINNIQMTGLSGVGVNIAAACADATANLTVGRVQNLTNRYNVITDTGNVIRNFVFHAGDMGVVADGTTDNTTTLNAIFTMFTARGGGRLFLQRGTTLATGQLELLGDRVTIFGDTAGGTYLKSTYASGSQFRIGDTTNRADEIYFENVTFWGVEGVHFFHIRYSRGVYFNGCKMLQTGGLLRMGDSGAASGTYIVELRDCEMGCPNPTVIVSGVAGTPAVNDVITFSGGATATIVGISGTTYTLRYLTQTPVAAETFTCAPSGGSGTLASHTAGVDFINVEYGMGELNIYNCRIEGGYNWTVSGINFSENAWENTPGVAGLFDTCGIHDTYLARFKHNVECIDRRLGNINWSNVRFHEAGVSAIQLEIPTGSTRALDRTGGGSGLISNVDVSAGYPFSGVYAKGIVIKNDSTVNSYIGDLVINGVHAAQMKNSLVEINSQRSNGIRGLIITNVNASQASDASMDVIAVNAGSTTAFTGVLINNVNGWGTFSDVIASVGGSTPDGGLRIGESIHASGTFSSRINGALARAGENAGSATYDPASLADGDGVTTTVTVTGAALGDITRASFSLDLQGIQLHSWVSSANTVSVRFQNETGGAIDLGSGTIRAIARMAG